MRKQIKVVTLVGVAVVFTALSMMVPAPAQAMETIHWICHPESVCGGCEGQQVCARKVIIKIDLWGGPCCTPTTVVHCMDVCESPTICTAICPPPWEWVSEPTASEGLKPAALCDHEPVSPVESDSSKGPSTLRDRHGVEDAAR